MSVNNPGMYAAAHAISSMNTWGDPRRHDYCVAMSKIMAGIAPTKDDMSIIQQGMVMCREIFTDEIQEFIDEVNERFGTTHTLDGRG